MIRLLPGLLLIQLLTAGLVVIGVRWMHEPQLIAILFALAILLAVLTAFWFASITRGLQHATTAKLKEKHAREREKILLRMEREKAKAAKSGQSKANFKVGTAFAVAVGAGGIMIVSQLVTVGMMVLIASGSGLAGYLARARQEQQPGGGRLSLAGFRRKRLLKAGTVKKLPDIE